ncbi:MAG: hypothetical protein ACLFWF_05095 [Alphaproteobacteria bacterium]
MSGNLWKRAAAAVLAAAALTACSTKEREGPVFATAEPVAAAKPDKFGFKHAVRVTPLEGLTETVRRNLTVVLKPEDLTASLRQSLANDEMLAPEGAEPAYELTPVFVDLRTMPVSEEATAAQAVFRYRVVRKEDDLTIFDRQVEAEFTSVADPAFADGGMFSRTLRLVGLAKPDPAPVVAGRSGMRQNQAPGPEGDTAREIHAARNAIALNVRQAMRYLIASSPQRMPAPMPVEAVPEADGGEEPAGGTQEPPDETSETEPDTSGPDGEPLPPLAPKVDSGS